MSNLTAKAVHEMMHKCLFRDDTPEDELRKKAVIVDGIVCEYGFNPAKIAEHKEGIKQLLADLPDDFMFDKGGGMSFLNACMTRDGEHWGEHPDMGALFALGQAAGFVTCLLAREHWSKLPGGMPYYQVNLNPKKEGELGLEPR